MGDKKLTFKEKASIKFVDGGDPKFLKDIKSKMGYREPATVVDKFKTDEEEDEPQIDRDDIRNMTEEERPQIVVLNEATDISHDELQTAIDEHKKAEEKKKIDSGQITFRKPEKRITTDADKKEAEAKKPKADEATMKKLQSSKLLSFGDEEDE
ncbi:hypothetical protein Ddc_03807 [Ditylenchus destructor]|nr:hypothetical protein Ddc_03807 [Ditylenchus destructor]